jgi:hypothetical protein
MTYLDVGSTGTVASNKASARALVGSVQTEAAATWRATGMGHAALEVGRSGTVSSDGKTAGGAVGGILAGAITILVQG